MKPTPDERIDLFLKKKGRRGMSEHDVYGVKNIIKNEPAWLFIVLGLLLVILVFFRPWVQIGAGERGVLLNFGAVQERVLDEGLHFRIPVMQQVVPVDVRFKL